MFLEWQLHIETETHTGFITFPFGELEQRKSQCMQRGYKITKAALLLNNEIIKEKIY